MALPQPAARGEAVDDGHHHVEHDRVGRVDVDGFEGLGAVPDGLDLVALEAQTRPVTPQALVVLGYQDVALRLVANRRSIGSAGKTAVRTTLL